MRRRWFSRRALGLHLLLAVWFPGCLVAGWWQATVAMSGNTLSYLYAVEWPAFAVFGAVVWWNLVHDEPGENRTRIVRRPKKAVAGAPDVSQTPALDPELAQRAAEEDPEMAAYNAYLAALAEQGPKTWRQR